MADLASLLLEEVAGVPGVVVAVDPSIREIPSPALGPAAGLHGRAVLLRTGWDNRWATASYREPGPYLAVETAEVLVRAGARVVGVDFANVDDTVGDARPVHAQLLGHGVPVVEHLTNLTALPPTGFRFYAVPLPIVRGASVPVRAFAEIE